ncbi:AlpA family phage regulatory protein [Comamonas thiooxydans]|uniref:AlpA family phage regulatory protein n=1 Tax=Comamonas thiooxydans TaxID=363952 RepID=UPI00263AB16A|nr:AlpA family phage regulatory protein [Comamonas thiooxydans]
MDEVLTRTGLSRSMLYKLLRKDKFPHPTPMSNRAIGWFEMTCSLIAVPPEWK